MNHNISLHEFAMLCSLMRQWQPKEGKNTNTHTREQVLLTTPLYRAPEYTVPQRSTHVVQQERVRSIFHSPLAYLTCPQHRQSFRFFRHVCDTRLARFRQVVLTTINTGS